MPETIREQSTAALAEALRDGCRDPFACDGAHEEQAEHVLAASPAVARRLDFATAWDEAVAALPEGTTLSLIVSVGSWLASYQHLDTECERCGVIHQCEDSGYVKGWGDNPTDALIALAEALRERAR